MKSLEQLIKSARREAALRKNVYPKWVDNPNNKMTQEQADHEIACMDQIADTLVALSVFATSIGCPLPRESDIDLQEVIVAALWQFAGDESNSIPNARNVDNSIQVNLQNVDKAVKAILDHLGLKKLAIT